MMEKKHAVIIGGGLSGLTTAYYLAGAGFDVTILEQGKEYEKRNIENATDVLIGLGGAGTISGGKLCFPPASGGIWRKTRGSMSGFAGFCNDSFSEMHTLLAFQHQDDYRRPSEIVKKRYRTEIVLKEEMRRFVTGLIQDVVRRGVLIRNLCCVDNVCWSTGGHKVSFQNANGEREQICGDYVILATGRTSAPFLQSLFGQGQYHQPDLGIRLMMDTKQPAFSGTGEDVKLKCKLGDFLVRTFCVCCGGESIKTSTRGYIHFDGHFEENITCLTNLGIMARSPVFSGRDSADHYLHSMQKYVDAEISLKDFFKHHRLLSQGTIYTPLFEVLAEFITKLYNGGMIAQNADEIPVFLPAVDHVNPLIYTDDRFESRFPNVFVTGDASGVSRGFVQAMWSGYCASEKIIRNLLFKEITWKVV